MPALLPRRLADAPDGEPSAAIAERVARAHERQQRRQGHPNARLAVRDIDTHCAMDEPTRRFAQGVAARLGWSARSFHRVLKVARTVADLAGSDRLATAHVAEAIQLRRGLQESLDRK